MYYPKHKMKYSALSWFAFGMLHESDEICVRSTFRLEDSMKTGGQGQHENIYRTLSEQTIMDLWITK